MCKISPICQWNVGVWQSVSCGRLTVLNPGKRRTAVAVSRGNGRNCFMASEVWTAGTAGRTRAGMRPFWHVLPAGGGVAGEGGGQRQQRVRSLSQKFTNQDRPSAGVCLVRFRLNRGVFHVTFSNTGWASWRELRGRFLIPKPPFCWRHLKINRLL